MGWTDCQGAILEPKKAAIIRLIQNSLLNSI